MWPCAPLGSRPAFRLFAGTAALTTLLVSACTQGTPRPGDHFPADGRALFPDLEAVVGLPDQPREGATSEFWEWWGDGQAELSGYRLTLNRYGDPREAELALIYVTEPHDRRSWIKDDDARGRNRVEVLKLNSNAFFLTGIYPYGVMTSVFSPVDRYREERFQPVRIVHSAQEWCGAYSHMVWPGPDRLRSLRLSYFAGEDERVADLAAEPGTLYEDALLIQLRELDGPFAGGGEWEGWVVPALWRVRAGHGDPSPVRARITREEGVGEIPVQAHPGEGFSFGGSAAARPETVSSPSTSAVPVTRFTLEAGDYRRVIDVERDHPRRILGWTTSTGEEAVILATERLPYWRLNRLGDESYRELLGLSPRGILPPGAGNPSQDPPDAGDGPVC